MINYPWVTFYEDLVNGISEVRAHENKKSAIAEFRILIRNHFDVFQVNFPIKPPTFYGNDIRRVHIMRYEDFSKEVDDVGGLISFWKERY